MSEEKNIVEEAIEEAKAAAKEPEQDVVTEEVEAVEGVVEDTEAQEEVEATEVADETDTVEETKTEKKKKKLFKKADPKDEKIAELTDRVTRQMAEFDNFRKRSEKEKSERYEIGAKDIIEKILSIVDNFERGFQGVSEEDMANPFVDGMDKIYKQLLTTLEAVDVKAIPATGEEFNPELHNAVMHIEDEELGENIVAEEFQKGYTYRNHVVRHSMVKVAN
ncbi:MAG: nucleotide exchange factor GrpE [Eubacteriales bacterium]